MRNKTDEKIRQKEDQSRDIMGKQQEISNRAYTLFRETMEENMLTLT